eukprot:SM002653S09920  [mRNA]  locus=s2653:51:1620:- [translate_table: standard]
MWLRTESPSVSHPHSSSPGSGWLLEPPRLPRLLHGHRGRRLGLPPTRCTAPAALSLPRRRSTAASSAPAALRRLLSAAPCPRGHLGADERGGAPAATSASVPAGPAASSPSLKLVAPGSGSETQYCITLRTSRKQGSSPSQPNAIAHVAVIGADGRALLQLLPLDQREEQSFTFRSVDVRPISRLWVGPATGSWRLEQAVVVVGQASTDAERLSSIGSSAASTSDGSAQPSCELKNEMYVFQAGGELLGDGGQAEAVELRPASAGEASRILSSMQGHSTEEVERLRLESMDEYQALKAELLLTAAVATGEDRRHRLHRVSAWSAVGLCSSEGTGPARVAGSPRGRSP